MSERIDQLSRQVDMFAPSDEVVRWLDIPKPAGGCRRVYLFPLLHRLRQWLIKEVVNAVVARPAGHYGVRGYGAARAVTDLACAIDHGRPYVLTADITRAFASVKIEAIYGFNLIHPDVLRYALDHRHMNISANSLGHLGPNQGSPVHHLLGTDLNGLLGGSSASNSLFTWLLRDIAHSAPAGCFIAIYSDNIAVACPSEAMRNEVEERLVSYLADHPAGPLELNVERHDVGAGIDFLGYHLSMPQGRSSSLVEPCDGHLAAIEQRAAAVARAYARNIFDDPWFGMKLARELTAHLPAIDDSYIELLAMQIRLDGLGHLEGADVGGVPTSVPWNPRDGEALIVPWEKIG